MKGLGRVALLPPTRFPIRIRGLKGMEGRAVFVPVKVTVCATSGVVRCRRMPGVQHQT